MAFFPTSDQSIHRTESFDDHLAANTLQCFSTDTVTYKNKKKDGWRHFKYEDPAPEENKNKIARAPFENLYLVIKII